MLGAELGDLLQPAERAALTKLSQEQELALAAIPKLLLVTYSTKTNW